MHSAKVAPAERKRSARRRYETGVATFAALLAEEAHAPEAQKEWRAARSRARNEAALKKARRLVAKHVSDRVRRWLKGIEPVPRLDRSGAPWYEGIFTKSS